MTACVTEICSFIVTYLLIRLLCSWGGSGLQKMGVVNTYQLIFSLKCNTMIQWCTAIVDIDKLPDRRLKWIVKTLMLFSGYYKSVGTKT